MPRRVAILVYPGFQLLDAAGPSSVFATANSVLSKRRLPPAYELLTVSAGGGIVASNGGVGLETEPIAHRPPPLHTFMVVGAERQHLAEAVADPVLRLWVPQWAQAASRFGSVCTGTFVLAAFGMATGKRVASHWSACKPLAAQYPSLEVDENSIFVEDGKVWTSAGVTTGIDMSLAMVARDTSPSIANDVAKRLVLYARRPGYQSQFSALLRAQITADNPFADLIEWAGSNLDAPLEVASLAERVGLTERTFFRKFVAATGDTPARFIETIRLDAARVLLSQKMPLKQIAAKVGLSPPARLNNAFSRRFGLSPALFRELHSSGELMEEDREQTPEIPQ